MQKIIKQNLIKLTASILIFLLAFLFVGCTKNPNLDNIQNNQEIETQEEQNTNFEEEQKYPNPQEDSENEKSDDNNEEDNNEKDDSENYEIRLKTYESAFSYTVNNLDFTTYLTSEYVAIYFEFKLYKDNALVDGATFNIVASSTKCELDSSNYNSVYIRIREIGSYTVTLSVIGKEISKTINIIVL